MVDVNALGLDTLSILYVEDDLINQMVIKSLLKSVGIIQVTVAGSAKETLTLLENTENHFDIILMDIGLPDMDGIRLTETIRKANFKLSAIPIIAVTGNDDSLHEQKSYLAGMNSFLSKPIEKEKLLLAIENVIHMKPL